MVEGLLGKNYNLNYNNSLIARVVELVDTRDLKSLASNGMTVQVRLRVPHSGKALPG